jgi:hypothetical protein
MVDGGAGPVEHDGAEARLLVHSAHTPARIESDISAAYSDLMGWSLERLLGGFKH